MAGLTPSFEKNPVFEGGFTAFGLTLAITYSTMLSGALDSQKYHRLRSAARAGDFRTAFENKKFRVALSSDVLGVAWCAILKNVYALSLGMCDGMSYSVNTKSALATWALREMAEFIETIGGKKETVLGLAGMGDLITTGFSEHGRNRQAGELICKNN